MFACLGPCLALFTPNVVMDETGESARARKLREMRELQENLKKLYELAGLTAGQQHATRGIFQQFDGNGDGEVTRKRERERERYFGPRPGADGNGDGEVPRKKLSCNRSHLGSG